MIDVKRNSEIYQLKPLHFEVVSFVSISQINKKISKLVEDVSQIF